nr:HD domain-containing protein [Lachnospiraceae bacterium]
MNKINSIISNAIYQNHIRKIAEWEKEREFCRHDTVHFTDVARIAMILNLQEGYGLEQEMIYAAALLHDIGRWQQYETGEDHALVSARLAPAILNECGFSEADSGQIVSAIATHRESRVKDDRNLNGLLYRADKLSRPCYFCGQEKNCNWKDDKKNMVLEI